MITAVFLLSILITVSVLVMSYKNFLKGVNDLRTFRGVYPLVCSVILILLSAAGSARIINPGPYLDAWYFSAFVSAVSCFISRLSGDRFRKEIRFVLRLLAAVSVLELTLFNLPSYKLMTGDYPVREISYSDMKILQGGSIENNELRIDENSTFQAEINKLNIPVGTVFADVTFYDNNYQSVHFSVDVKDETQSKEYRNEIVKSEIITGYPDSNYILCDFSGEVSSLRFSLGAPSGSPVTFTRILINTPVPFSIQYIRFFIIMLTGTFIYCIMKSSIFERKYSESQRLTNFAAYIVTILSCLAVFLIIDYKLSPSTWNEAFHQETGNQVSQELVDAFRSGHVTLEKVPEEFLTELDNPYDRQERESAGVTYSWDHVYYNGHYYSYYGIAPVILLFLPYNLITGYYCSDSFAILVFAFIAVSGITMMYMSFIRKWFADISSGIVIACLFIIQLSSGLWYSVGRPDFYEIALLAGLAFVSWAIYFLFESNVIGEGKISKFKTAVSSFLFAVAVLSRPTLALYCICAAVFMILAVPKVNEYKKNANGRYVFFTGNSVSYLMCAIVPMVCLGLVQMIYNYVRFGSPLDFGIQYSLTINDFTKSQYHLKFSMIAIYNYLFNVPIFQTEYPFVRSQFQNMNSTGFFYADIVGTLNSSGLFMLVPLSFYYLAFKRALKEIPDRRLKLQYVLRIFIPCLIVPLIIIASVWESGYAVRYMQDFSIEVILGAYAVMLFILKTTKNHTIKMLIKYSVCFSVVWVIYVEGVQIVNQAFRYQEAIYVYPNVAHKLEQIIAFWK